MSAGEIHVADIGTQFIVTIKDEDSAVVNISSATTKQLTFSRPNGTSLVVSGTLVTDGTDGKMKYTTVSGDLSVAGIYRLQGYVVISGLQLYSDIVSFKVFSNL